MIRKFFQDILLYNSIKTYQLFRLKSSKLNLLYPGENIPIEWIDMIANGDKELANNIRKSYVHKLGNLTLTGYNSNLSNLSLIKKQERKNNEGKYIGFKNDIMLNELIKDTSSCTNKILNKEQMN
jgi:hypothetical protein